ncbi:MAG: hypothetical protein KDA29_01990 [Phycisphaerales bacterium]|nr:hypothetical protein [Phycisphaerales bacterium]
MLKRLSNLRLLGIAALMLLLSVAIAIYPTLTFVRGFFIGTLHPLEQFDSGETLEFSDDSPYSRYVLSMEVDERNPPLPDMQVMITASDGTVPHTEPINRWNSIMGREFKQFLVIEPPADGRLTIRIDTEDNEDFLVYRRIEDVVEHELKRSTPLWLVACVPLVIMIVLMGILITRLIRDSDQLSLSLKDEL